MSDGHPALSPQEIATADVELRAWAAVLPADGDAPAPGTGPLAGIAIGVKDIIDTADFPTECGSPAFAGRRPRIDAEIVKRLRAAGATIMGKTVSTEFGMKVAGVTRNPHDLTRTPGGSSSGSAAAVAAGHVPLAVGSQTTGSIVRPAAFCGVFGYKPTVGLIDRSGTLLHSTTMDTLGFLSSTPELLRPALAVATDGLSEHLRTTPPGPGGGAVKFLRTHNWGLLDDLSRSRIESAVQALAEHLGAPVEHVELPVDGPAAEEAHRLVYAYESARSLYDLRESSAHLMSEHSQAIVERGMAISRSDYQAALDQRAAMRDVTNAWLGGDFVLAPATTGIAPEGIHDTGDSSLCRMWSYIGVPCVAVPGITGELGLPLGIQAIGAYYNDVPLIDFVHKISTPLADLTQ